MTELKWEHETSHTAVPIRYITDDQHHQHHHHSGGHVPIHSDDQVTVLAPNVVTAYDDHQQVYTQVHDDTKQATYQLWKLEPPQQPQEIIVHTTSQSTGQSGSTVIEDIGAHENDFDMMLYDEPSQQDTQNGNDVVLTEKGSGSLTFKFLNIKNSRRQRVARGQVVLLWHVWDAIPH